MHIHTSLIYIMTNRLSSDTIGAWGKTGKREKGKGKKAKG